MPSAREIRRRIRSIKNTTQITRAMEMVSAAKMRRAQAAVFASRPYAVRMSELVSGLSAIASTQDDLDPLLVQRPIQQLGLIVVTADRGLAGPLNSNVMRNVARFLVEQTVTVSTLAIGRRGRDWLARHGSKIIAEVSGMGTVPTLLDVSPISTVAIDG